MSGSGTPRLPDRASIKRMFPKGAPAWVSAFADAVPELCVKHKVNTAERWRHAMAQFAAETDGLSIPNMREQGFTKGDSVRYSAKRIQEVFSYRLGLAQKRNPEFAGFSKAQIASLLSRNPKLLAETVYGNRRELGNVNPGDGYKFIGRGPPQTTGREWYEKLGRKLGVDLINNPELLEDPKIGVPAAFLEWELMGLNELADTGNVTAVSKRLNGGTNGLSRRKSEYRRACTIWPDDWELDAVESVKTMQPEMQTPRYSEYAPTPTPPPETTVHKEAVRSKSVWLLVVSMLTYLTDGIRWLFEQVAWLFSLIPETATEVSGVMTPLKEMGGMLNLQVGAIGSAVVVGAAGIVIFRHSRDKKSKSDAERKLAQIEGDTE